MTETQGVVYGVWHKTMLIEGAGGVHSCIQDLRRAVLEIPGRRTLGGRLASGRRTCRARVAVLVVRVAVRVVRVAVRVVRVAVVVVHVAVVVVHVADVELLASVDAQSTAGAVCAGCAQRSLTARTRRRRVLVAHTARHQASRSRPSGTRAQVQLNSHHAELMRRSRSAPR